MARTYSETFVYSEGAGVGATYIVPEKKRAVIRSIVVCQVGGNLGLVQVKMHTTVLVQFQLPAPAQTYTWEMRQVAYRRHSIFSFCQVSGVYVTVAGYLFDDPDNAGAPPPGAGTKPAPEPAELLQL